MANAASDHLEDAILGLFVGTDITAPTALYVGLFTTLPADTGSSGSPQDGTEVSGGSYARVTVGTLSSWLGSISTTNTTERHRTNANTLTFPQATGSWGTVVGYGIWDASTSGNLWFYGSITSKAVATNDTPSLASGTIDIGVD